MLAIGGLSLLCLLLGASLAAVLWTSAPLAEAAAEPAPSAAGPAAPPAEVALVNQTVDPATFPADPEPIPVDLLTRLEAASESTLDVELGRLLDAVQHGFGDRSARLEPTLQSYVYRMGSRFEWNPDSFRISVTAPDPTLAAARATLIAGLFEDAVAAGRLQIRTGSGPHALTVDTD